jgi:hypothetical protein
MAQFADLVQIIGPNNQTLEVHSTDALPGNQPQSVATLVAVSSNRQTEAQLQFNGKLTLASPVAGGGAAPKGLLTLFQNGSVGLGPYTDNHTSAAHLCVSGPSNQGIYLICTDDRGEPHPTGSFCNLQAVVSNNLSGGEAQLQFQGQFSLVAPASGIELFTVTQNGNIFIRGADGVARLQIDGNVGDISLLGADCAEQFDIEDGEPDAEPGSVMVLSESGRLRRSDKSYDRRVAGIVSGAADLRAGIVLGKRARLSHRSCNLALTGTTYCKVDANISPIEVGDLLTTSDCCGHAMKAADPCQAFGAILGKAMSSLRQGLGLIPILIALQ